MSAAATALFIGGAVAAYCQSAFWAGVAVGALALIAAHTAATAMMPEREA